MKEIVLKRTKRINEGHLWVFSNEIGSRLSDYTPGELVRLIDRKGNFHGIGYINPHTLIAVRILSYNDISIDRDFFYGRIKKAIQFRKEILGELPAQRLIFSEGDLLPGLIVDRYADVLSVQFLTAGMEVRKLEILEILDELLSPSAIAVRNDSPFRKLEGLPNETLVYKGEVKGPVEITEGELKLRVDVSRGQKTGFFLDQRENRLLFSSLIKGGRGLDLFSYSGAWAAHAAIKGAEVIAVDSSEQAVRMIKENASINGLSASVHPLRADVFEFLRDELDGGETYDFIVLDPPAFVKSKTSLKTGMAGYRRINEMALGLLRPGGILATSSCSYHLSEEAFLKVLLRAARSAGKLLRLIEIRSQARDHPVLLSMPETRYLKCIFAQVL